MSSSVYNQRQIHAFDPLGRVLSDSQTTIVQDSPWTAKGYVFSYTYNRDGSLASQTYPSGRVVNFTYDSSGRPYSVQEPSSGPSYLNSVYYAAHGGVDNLQLGNTLVEQTCYNDLLQPVARRLGNATSSGCAVQTSTDLLHLGFGYGTASANNGNMIEQSIWAPDNVSGSPWQVTQDYTYDAVNRLATAAEKLSGVTQWSRTYSYENLRKPYENLRKPYENLTKTCDSQVKRAGHREVATLVWKGRLELDRPTRDWMVQALAQDRVEPIPLSPEIAARPAYLGDDIYGDPAARFLIATALERGTPLVTRDRAIASSGIVRCVW